MAEALQDTIPKYRVLLKWRGFGDGRSGMLAATTTRRDKAYVAIEMTGRHSRPKL